MVSWDPLLCFHSSLNDEPFQVNRYVVLGLRNWWCERSIVDLLITASPDWHLRRPLQALAGPGRFPGKPCYNIQNHTRKLVRKSLRSFREVPERFRYYMFEVTAPYYSELWESLEQPLVAPLYYSVCLRVGIEAVEY